MNSNGLVAKYQELKSQHEVLVAEKLKCEAKKEQISLEIKSIQDKYPEYDLSSMESVEKVITELTNQLNDELANITEQYNKIKAV